MRMDYLTSLYPIIIYTTIFRFAYRVKKNLFFLQVAIKDNFVV